MDAQMKAMRATKLALITVATSAAAVALAATAHAEPSSMYQFLSPSGNIGCHMDGRDDGTAYAWCRLQDQTWVEPQSGDCAVGNVPGSIGKPAPYLQLSQGNPPCLGFVMSQLFFSGPDAPPTLEYGQTHTVGTITCGSEPSGVMCTDSSTGQFFRVSRDSYQLG
jgi:hypothetical protein